MADQETTFGPNAWLVDEMYDQYRADPSSVSESWRDFFADERDGEQPAKEPVQTATESAQEDEADEERPAAKKKTEKKKPESKAEPEEDADQPEPIRGAAARIVQNMEAS